MPHCLIHCHAPTCVDHDHFDIEDYYNSIVTAVSKATAMIVPPSTADRGKLRVSGWSDYAQEKYDIARDAYIAGCMPVNLEVVFIITLCVKQEAQLSQRYRATLYVVEYFAKSLKITQGHTAA